MSGETIKLIEEKIEELYNSLMDKPLRVLGIFNDFFGEDKVDMQGYWSLDKFKSWMNIEPLSTYIPNGSIVSMNSNDVAGLHVKRERVVVLVTLYGRNYTLDNTVEAAVVITVIG